MRHALGALAHVAVSAIIALAAAIAGVILVGGSP